MTREEGILDTVLQSGTEIRFHYFNRDGGVVRRIPWHLEGESWYSGIEGPEIKASTFEEVSEMIRGER